MPSIQSIIRAVKGLIFKYQVDSGIDLKLNKIKGSDRKPKLVVSLTSYGRRVNNVVYYTLISLFKQTLMPDRIILWLDENSWNKDNIPKNIQKLQKLGLDIYFCKDIRSYTKLVPALTLYKNEIIITVDDDVIYPTNLIEKLYNAYLEEPQKVHSGLAREISFTEDKINPYNSWLPAQISSLHPFPTGYGGILYPPNTLHQDVTNEELFMKICPYADDIWFYVMARAKGTTHSTLALAPNSYTGIDIFQQYFHKGFALSHFNVDNNGNDTQLQNAIEKYNVRLLK